MKYWGCIILLSAQFGFSQKVESIFFDWSLHMLLKNDVPSIDADDQLLKHALLLDTRTREEYAVSHLPKAIFIEDFVKPKDTLTKNFPIVVYCSIGYRSEEVCRQLRQNGFVNAYNLYGGIFEYMNRGHNLVNENSPTDSIHAYNYFWGLFLERGTKVY